MPRADDAFISADMRAICCYSAFRDKSHAADKMIRRMMLLAGALFAYFIHDVADT